MIYSLKREKTSSSGTVGKLFLNDEFICDTLEPLDRGLRSDMSPSDIAAIKVPGKTAIPLGRYRLTNAFWKKHDDYYPCILDVPGFSGIMIHNGLSVHDTKGCILVGAFLSDGSFAIKRNLVRSLVDDISKHWNEKILIDISALYDTPLCL